jgi:tetratricopeptide (TPR) repeat protein
MEAPPPRPSGRPSRPPARHPPASSWPPPPLSLDAKIEDAEQVVDTMLAWLARGALASDAWDKLRASAIRDGCVEAVGAAFGSVSCGPRVKMVPPQVAAELHWQAARFCDEAMGDDLGAAMQLERCLALAPGHLEAFAKMEAILGKSQRPDKLSQLYATVAPQRPRGQQALMLRRAAEWLGRAEPEGSTDEQGEEPSTVEKALGIWQEIVRLEPGDNEARARLEALYVQAGRYLDAVRLNEQSLARDPAKDAYSKGLLLERIVELYADRLEQPERAIAAVEQLLLLDPSHPVGRRVGERLLAVPGLAGRTASALSVACEGDAPDQVERYLTVELESAHGSRRTQLLARLGRLRQDRLEDFAGAIEAYEQALDLDPADAEVRGRYVALAMKLGWYGDVTRVLERLIPSMRDASTVLAANVELGEALHARGEDKRAKPILAAVLESLSAPRDLVLRAARALCAIYEATYERRALCDALDRIAVLETDADARRDANLRLAAAAQKARDSARAIEAYERLLASTARTEALEALDQLYRGASQREKYARLLAAEAAETDDPTRARGLMMRAAEVRAREVNDAPGAMAALQAIVRRFGSDRDVDTLLEQVQSRMKA